MKTYVGRIVGISAATLILMILPVFGEYTMQTKTCKVCKNTFDISNFYKKHDTKDGLALICKQCSSKQCSKYRSKHRKELAKKQRQYYRDNLETTRKYNKYYYIKNKEEIKEQQKEYYKKNKTKRLEQNKIYRINNLDVFRKNRHIREARQKSLLHDLTNEQWTSTLEYFNNCCAYCSNNNIRLQQDHVIPVIKDGPYTKSNVIPACQSCNSSKGIRDYQDFAKSHFKAKITRFINKYTKEGSNE